MSDKEQQLRNALSHEVLEEGFGFNRGFNWPKAIKDAEEALDAARE